MTPARGAVLVWVVLLAAVSGRVLLSPPMSQTVVPIYRAAAERWLRGENLYTPAPPLDVYRNPPGFALMFVPFAILPERLAAVLWRLFSAAVFLTGLHRLTRHVLPIPPKRVGLFHLVAAVMAIPSVNNGQVNVLLLGLMMHGTVALVRGHLGSAAVYLGGAAGLKLYPVAAAMLLVGAVPRLGGRLAIVILGILVLPVLSAPDYALGQYESLLAHFGVDDRSQSPFLPRAPHDWTMVPRIWGDVAVSRAAATRVSAVAGLLMVGLVLHVKRSRGVPRAIALAFGLGSIWMTLFGPATEVPTYTLLAPTAAYAVAVRPRVPAWLAIGLLLAPILRGMFPSSDVLACRSTQALGSMLLLVIVVREACRAVPLEAASVFSARMVPERQRTTPGLFAEKAN